MRYIIGMEIKTVFDFRKAFRETKNIYPGGYEFVFLCDDGGEICRKCAKKHARNIIESISQKINNGWRVTYSDSTSNMEAPVICDNCNKILLDVE